MHKKNRRVKRTCECGKTFHPTIKFGNEEMCDACYKAHSEEFMDWFDSLSDKQQRKALEGLKDVAATLGINVDEQEQAHTPATQDDASLPAMYEQMTDDQQLEVADAVVEIFAKVMGKGAKVEEVNPEQVDADNQAAIDAAFGELMDGVL